MAQDMGADEMIEHLFHDWDNPAYQQARAEQRKASLIEIWGDDVIG